MFGPRRKCLVVLLLHLLGVSVAFMTRDQQKADIRYFKEPSQDEIALQPAVQLTGRQAASFDKVLRYPYETYKLESNDLEVIIVPLGDEFPGIVSVQTLVQAGSRDDLEPGKSGMAHFFEHMMFRGTASVSTEEFQSTYDQMGASFNAFTSPDITNYYTTFPSESASGANNLETVMYQESDRFKNINYTEADFKTEAGAILGEYNSYADTVFFKMDVVRRNASYSVHPYRHSTLGTIEDIRDMPNEMAYSRIFFDRFYKPENTVLMVFGDIDVNETKAIIEEYWGDWERGEGYVSDVLPEPVRDAAIYEHAEWPEPTPPLISVSFNAANFSVEEPDMAALDIILFALFFDASVLYEKLVAEDEVALGMEARIRWGKDPTLFLVQALVADADSVWYVRDEILKALAKARVVPMTSGLLETAKSALYYASANGVDSTTAVGDYIRQGVGLGSPEAINQIYELYETITPEIALEIANKYFTDTRLLTVTLSYSEDKLPEPPSPLSLDDDAFAGSIDSIVAALRNATSLPVQTLAPDTATPIAAAPSAAPLVEEENVYPIDQVLIQSESSRLATFDIRFRVGSTDDPAGKEGLAAITASMVYAAGSTSLTIDEINDILFPIWAGFFGETGKEYTSFEGSVHLDNLDSYYDTVSEMLLSPGFREEQFERIKTQHIREAQNKAFDDGSLATRAFDSSIFDGHPYNKQDTVPSIQGLTLEDVKDFYATQYTKQNLILGLAGGVSDQFANRVISDLTKRLPEGQVDKQRLVGPPARAESNAVIVQQDATAATTITIGHSFPMELVSRNHPDYAAMLIVYDYFGSGFGSVLVQEIREKRGINYGNSAGALYSGMGSEIFIGAVDTVELAHFATRLAVFQLNKMLAQGISQDRFEETRNELFNVIPLFVDTPAKILSFAMDGVDLGYGNDFLTYARSALTNVTLDEVNEAARRWLKTENLTFVFVTPDAEDLEARLVNETTSTITYLSNTQPEQVLLDDEVIKDYPLGLTSNNIEIKTPGDLFPGYDVDIGVVAEEEEEVAVERNASEVETMEGNNDADTVTNDGGESNSATSSVRSFNAGLGGSGLFLLSLAAALWT